MNTWFRNKYKLYSLVCLLFMGANKTKENRTFLTQSTLIETQRDINAYFCIERYIFQTLNKNRVLAAHCCSSQCCSRRSHWCLMNICPRGCWALCVRVVTSTASPSAYWKSAGGISSQSWAWGSSNNLPPELGCKYYCWRILGRFVVIDAMVSSRFGTWNGQ